ncbi:hypothetical protein M0D45_19035 [Xanthomonas prunicola]|uniref:hypothetical protein n=1 Tax=Xanthomonas prunicola TaxID=2053930 RepID=UPI0021B21959|nr:hypothetical protein [Xanthomonas prunicola]UXA52707.1 hypothetical protein M0D45_19035 [Xanthomonas prunicola]
MEEPNKSALVLLHHEASELLALFDQLRGDAPPADGLAGAVVRSAEHDYAVNVTN